MSNVIADIFHLFSSTSIDEGAIEETFIDIKLSVLCYDLLIPSQEDFDAIKTRIKGRDSINVVIVQNNISHNYVQEDAECNYAQFAQECLDIQQAKEKRVTVSISKKKIDGVISIYMFDKFVEYLQSLTCVGFLFKVREVFNGDNSIIFEVIGRDFVDFSTSTIRFIPNGCENQNISRKNADNIAKVKNLCHCSIIDQYQFVPDDFYPIVKSDTHLDDIFSRIALLYSAIFLFDIFNIGDNNRILYRLNGYRAINEEMNFMDIDISSYETYYNIYNWVYEGGNIVDKIGLARNILSLNFDKTNLRLVDTTFEAIKSSYNIYQKENIKQYIDIRNKISDQLIELQNKADKIVGDFVSDYKRSFLAVVSFFISVIVIRVVSNGDLVGGFTFEVTLLSIGFLCVSLIVMFYARWEISKQLDRYTESYNNLKKRHRDLLEESDINRILNNDTDFDSNKLFIVDRRNKYTTLWSVSLGVLFVVAIILFLINNLNFCQLLKGLLCCIGSMFQ